MSKTETLQPTTCELLDSLRCFPRDVLPIRVLRELTQRGASIQDEVLRRLDKLVANQKAGIGRIPYDCFFCFGLMIAHPCLKQLPTLERLFRLDSDMQDALASELLHEVPRILLVKIAQVDGPTSVVAWLDRMLHDDSIGPWSAESLYHSFFHLVRDEIITRKQAIDWLADVLRRRASHKCDLQSTFALSKLSDLNGAEHDALVNECFDRQQIDEECYCRDDWESECGGLTATELHLERLEDVNLDLVEILHGWYCFPNVSYDLNPFGETLEPNPASQFGNAVPRFPKSEIDSHFQSLRDSNDHSFPREAVEALAPVAEHVKERLIEEVRYGLEKAGNPDARSSNGPFLALVLLIGDDVQIPRDIILRIIDLPEEQCMDLMGDAMDDAIAYALAISLHGDAAPIDARIMEPERSEMDRSALALFYPISSWLGHLTREDAIERLFEFWQSTLNDERGESALLSYFLLESLCIMSPPQHHAVLLQAVEQRGDSRLRKMIEDPSKGRDHLLACCQEGCNAMKLIEGSVMFDRECLHPRKGAPRTAAPTPKPAANPTAKPAANPAASAPTAAKSTTVRESKKSTPGRNAPCPCGSGKKYKKCCLRK